MRTELNRSEMNGSGINHATPTLDNPGFNQIEQSLSSALAEFSQQSPAMFAAVLGAIRPVGDYAMQGARFMAGYTRRHPVRIAVSVVGLIGIGVLAARWMMPTDEASTAAPGSADGRQY